MILLEIEVFKGVYLQNVMWIFSSQNSSLQEIYIELKDLTEVFNLDSQSNHSKKSFSDFNLFLSVLESSSHLIPSSKLMVGSNVWRKFFFSKCF